MHIVYNILLYIYYEIICVYSIIHYVYIYNKNLLCISIYNIYIYIFTMNIYIYIYTFAIFIYYIICSHEMFLMCKTEFPPSTHPSWGAPGGPGHLGCAVPASEKGGSTRTGPRLGSLVRPVPCLVRSRGFPQENQWKSYPKLPGNI